MEQYSKYLSLVCVVVLCLLTFSCKEDSSEIPIINPEEPTDTVILEKVLKGATIEWGLSREQIISHMDGYNQVKMSGSDMLQFITSKSEQSISYQLHNGKLCATLIMIPSASSDMNWQSLLNDYTYVGELSGCKVYENVKKNTMAAIWQPADTDSTYDAIGFTPIISDAYETVPPLSVELTKDASPKTLSCTLYGKVVGVDKSVEVGFIYSSEEQLSEYSGKKVSTVSQGDYSITLNRLLDDQKYYYRAYALIDDIYYLSDIKSFTTEQLTYELDGITYKFVKVEGGSMSPFSIMQTEYPHVGDSRVRLGSLEFGSPDGFWGNNDGVVIKTEFRSFMLTIRRKTGIPFRLPTPDEWEYAARGGNKSHGYTYSGSNNIDDVAWYNNNSDNSPHPVARKRPNELGLYDMSGNYAELCNTTKDTMYVDGPCYGGSYKDTQNDCKVTSYEEEKKGTNKETGISYRNSFDGPHIGFRLVYSRDEE